MLFEDAFEEAYELESTKGQGFCTGYNGLEVFDIDLKVLPTLQKQTEFWNEYLSFLQDNSATKINPVAKRVNTILFEILIIRIGFQYSPKSKCSIYN